MANSDRLQFIGIASKLNGRFISTLNRDELLLLIKLMSRGKEYGMLVYFISSVQPSRMFKAMTEIDACAILRQFETKINVDFDCWNDIPNSFFRVKFNSN